MSTIIDSVVAIALGLGAFYILVDAIYSKYRKLPPKPEIPPDPVKHCQVYRAVGCAHVDGPLCDMRTCDVDVIVQFRPKFQRIVNKEVL